MNWTTDLCSYIQKIIYDSITCLSFYNVLFSNNLLLTSHFAEACFLNLTSPFHVQVVRNHLIHLLLYAIVTVLCITYTIAKKFTIVCTNYSSLIKHNFGSLVSNNHSTIYLKAVSYTYIT